MLLSRLRTWMHKAPRVPRCRRVPRLELLEQRELLATFNVTNLLDSGAGSLRDAIVQANGSAGADLVTFDPTLFASGPQSINLSSQLVVSDDLTVSGPGAKLLTINGGAGIRGFEVFAANATFDGLTVANVTLGSLQDGGGIRFDGGGTLNVNNCVIRNNFANSAGGIYNAAGGTVNVTDSTLSGNQSGLGGVAGGIWNSGGTLNVTNSTLTGNVAQTNEAGAIWNNNGGTTHLLNDTIVGNSANFVGGGVWNQSGTVTVLNTIIAGNTSNTTSKDVNGNFTDLGFNLIGNATGSSGFTVSTLVGTSGNPIAPNVTALADFGGPTPTLALLKNSAAVNAGTLSGAPATDQRGAPRTGPQADIGAVQLVDFLVTTTADSGPGSLRQAILDANAHPGSDFITFNIPGGGVHTIAPSSQLPIVTDTVTIDGYAQPGSSANTLAGGENAVVAVALNGTSAGFVDSLTISTSGATVRGLAIGGFSGVGIFLQGNNNLVAGNFIGVAASGVGAAANQGGVTVFGAGNLIGGTNPSDRNIISANSSVGVKVSGVGTTNNLVEGNWIGLDATGARAGGQGFAGVELSNNANVNTVGGTTASARNVISGNDGLGVEVIGTQGCVIEGNYIGTDPSGNAVAGNAGGGVDVNGGIATSVGAAGSGNVISGNSGNGVTLSAGNGLGVFGNIIGLNAAGNAVLGNSLHGVQVFAQASTIGGDTLAERNIISGNAHHGIALNGTQSTIVGNYIGTDVTGSIALGNQSSGIGLNGATFNDVGDATPFGGNLISGNAQNGVELFGGSNNNVLNHNLIGVAADGITPLGNGIDGVRAFVGSSGNTIGGLGANLGNVIAFNAKGVVVTDTSTGNTISGNSIFANNGPGIDLGDDGPTPNGNPPSGPNNFQSFPVILTASGTTVSGTLNSAPSTSFQLEFYASPTSGSAEQGMTLLGTTTVVTDAVGNVIFSATVTPIPAGQGVTATATNLSTGDTSEFSVNPPATLTATSGGPQAAVVGTDFATPLRATVRDAFGNPISGVTVSFVAPTAGATAVFGTGINSFVTTTDAFGVAAASPQAGTVAGSYSLTASVAGVGTVAYQLTNNPGAASSLALTGSATGTAGVAAGFTVTALDVFGNVATGFSRTVTFTSSDGLAQLPSPHDFVPADAGQFAFNATFVSAGNDLLFANASGVIGAQLTVTVSAAAAVRLTLGGFPSNIPAGVPGMVTITAFDAFNNIATGYTGVLHFTSNDRRAVLPLDSMLAAGVGTFPVTFLTSGTKSITATDGATPSLKATQSGIVITAILLPFPVLFVPIGNQSFTFPVATFLTTLSLNPADFDADISWGDLTSTAGTVVSLGNGNFQVIGTHTYPIDETDYLVDVTITYKQSGAFETTAPSAAAVVTPSQGSLLLDTDLRRSKVGETSLALANDTSDATLKGLDPAGNKETVFLASYRGNPQPASTDGSTFYDVRVTGADPSRAALVVVFRFPQGGATDASLQFYDPAQGKYVPVRGSTRQDGSLVVNTSGKSITVLFDDTSFPRLRDLTGTVFTVAVTVPPQPAPAPSSVVTINPALALAYPTAGTATTREVSFQSAGAVTLGLSPSQDLTKSAGRAELSGGGSAPDEQSDEDLEFLLRILGLVFGEAGGAAPNVAAPADAPKRPVETAGPEAYLTPAGGANDAVFLAANEFLPVVCWGEMDVESIRALHENMQCGKRRSELHAFADFDDFGEMPGRELPRKHGIQTETVDHRPAVFTHGWGMLAAPLLGALVVQPTARSRARRRRIGVG